MTVAIGFNCDKTILLATDTHIVTPGVSKLNGSKLFRHEPPNGVNSVIATAGHFSYGRMAMQHIQSEFAALSDTGLKQIRDTLETTILNLHIDHIYSHPDRGTTARVELLVAVWSPRDKVAAIYWTEDSAVVEFPGYACIGCGSTLAHFLVKPVYRAQMKQELILPLALDVVERAKEFVDGVGGFTEWVTLNIADGQLSKTERVNGPTP
ncbi:MAG: hypothetical protein WA182_06190 [Candidatus Sulfotelmatobacter sp.]